MEETPVRDYESFMLNFAANGVDAAVYMKDLEGRMLYVNQYLADKLRLDSGDVADIDCSKIFDEDFRDLESEYESRLLDRMGDQVFQSDVAIGQAASEPVVCFKMLHRRANDQPAAIISWLRLLRDNNIYSNLSYHVTDDKAAQIRRHTVMCETPRILDQRRSDLKAGLLEVVENIPKMFESPDSFACQLRLGPSVIRSRESSEPLRQLDFILPVDDETAGSMLVAYCGAEAEDGERQLASCREALDSVATTIAAHVREDLYQKKYLDAMSRFRNTFEQAAVGLCHVSPTGRFISVNKRLCTFWGYAEEELRALRFQDITYPDDLELDLARLSELNSGEVDFYQINKRYYRKDGMIVWGRLTVSCVRGLDDAVNYYIAVVEDITREHRQTEQSEELEERLKGSLMATITALSRAMDQRDNTTASHQLRVEKMASAIAQRMGLDEFTRKGLEIAALVHDIGKFVVPTDILTRSCALTEEEFELVKEHPVAGYDILSGIDMPWPVADIVCQHHERLDGSGYPKGLQGEDILLSARIIAVADTWESMSAFRPYRAPRSDKYILEELQKMRGSTLDANAVDACIDVIRSDEIQVLVESG